MNNVYITAASFDPLSPSTSQGPPSKKQKISYDSATYKELEDDFAAKYTTACTQKLSDEILSQRKTIEKLISENKKLQRQIHVFKETIKKLKSQLKVQADISNAKIKLLQTNVSALEFLLGHRASTERYQERQLVSPLVSPTDHLSSENTEFPELTPMSTSL